MLFINCDMGEGCQTDAQVMPFIDYANISCGAHAGDEAQIKHTLLLAKQHQVIVGAHPGYADKENFGRVSLNLSLEALYDSINTQIINFSRYCKTIGIDFTYIKPHGALNQDFIANLDILKIFCRVIKDNDLNVALMVPTHPNSEALESTLKQNNIELIWEVFADRAYEATGLLRSRKLEGALHESYEKIIEQYQLIKDKKQIQVYGSDSFLNVSQAQSVCIHGDNPASVKAAAVFK